VVLLVLKLTKISILDRVTGLMNPLFLGHPVVVITGSGDDWYGVLDMGHVEHGVGGKGAVSIYGWR